MVFIVFDTKMMVSGGITTSNIVRNDAKDVHYDAKMLRKYAKGSFFMK